MDDVLFFKMEQDQMDKQRKSKSLKRHRSTTKSPKRHKSETKTKHHKRSTKKVELESMTKKQKSTFWKDYLKFLIFGDMYLAYKVLKKPN